MRGVHVCLLLVLCLSLVVFAIHGLLNHLNRRPAWEIAVEKAPPNSKLQVFLGEDQEPYYLVTLPYDQSPVEITRVSRRDLNSDEVKTIFFDETVKPGRWTLKIFDLKVDIMPSRMIVNDRDVYEPLPDREVGTKRIRRKAPAGR